MVLKKILIILHLEKVLTLYVSYPSYKKRKEPKYVEFFSSISLLFTVLVNNHEKAIVPWVNNETVKRERLKLEREKKLLSFGALL